MFGIDPLALVSSVGASYCDRDHSREAGWDSADESPKV